MIELAGGDPEDVKGEHVTAAAAEGDAQAVEIFSRFAWWLALGLANLANIYDPSVFVLGGGLVEAGDVLLAADARRLRRAGRGRRPPARRWTSSPPSSASGPAPSAPPPCTGDDCGTVTRADRHHAAAVPRRRRAWPSRPPVRAEALGLDGVFVFDHLWPIGNPDGVGAARATPLLGALAAETTRVRSARSSRASACCPTRCWSTRWRRWPTSQAGDRTDRRPRHRATR